MPQLPKDFFIPGRFFCRHSTRCVAENRCLYGQRPVLMFSQPDQGVARAMLADMQPGRLSGSSSIILGSGPNCTFLKTASVSRIDVLTDEPLPIASTIRDSARVLKAMRSFRCVKWPPSRRWVTALPRTGVPGLPSFRADRRAFAAGRTRAGACAAGPVLHEPASPV